MNEIEVKTITKEPAKIEFNHEEILKELDESLKKYDGLTFTEDQTTDLRKTLAELRKGVKAVDRYRIDTKKELNEPVTEFEKKCKEIVFKFDERIMGLDKQLKDFERERKAKKQVKVEEIIANVVNESNLEKKYADRLVVLEEYLAKSITNHRIKEMIEFKAEQLLIEQEKEHANQEVIETFVQLKNSEFGVNLSIEAYMSQLEFKDLNEVKNTVIVDAEKEVERNKVKEETEKEKYEEVPLSNAPSSISDDAPFEPVIDDLPFGDVAIRIEETYEITATNEEHEKIIKFLTENNIEFNVRKELPF